MSIPQLTPEGLLPPGVHECSIEEIRSRFGTFQQSERRPRLFQKLERFVAEARKTGLVVAVVIDGSFVTATPAPHDIDLIVLVHPGHNFDAELRPTEYNVLSRRLVRKHYAFDMLMAVDGSKSAEDYRRFFSQVRDRPETEKGMLCVRLVAAGDGVGGRKRGQR